MTRTYSREFSEKYHQMLHHQVERRMKASVKMVGDVWYTCWVNAGQPDLGKMERFPAGDIESKQEAAQQQTWLQRLFQARPEGDN